ncbi:flagellar M-ring protein FliF C-terminal domain-containing protein, partial [Aromatoleum bremense]
ATAPITNPALPGAANAGAGAPLNSNRSSTLNYELDRTIQHTRQALGQVRRLSVAVVVNHRGETLPNGQTRAVALTDEEVARLTNLVREAMGYSQARGDSLNVSNAPFAAPQEEAEAALPMWKDPAMIELGKELLKYLALFAALAFVYFGVIRPLLRSVAPPPKEIEATVEEGDDDEHALLGVSAAPRIETFDEKLVRAKELAQSDPKVVANLIKEWMGANDETKK